ncbi:EF-hand calcium-binding domain-containing 14 isoform X1 [Pelobates cultripes]|uniref:EF-hand calcium-binding domain-containing 14 isoform X1 n=2 Tax=Pelobates cultripes TaxID=61616 RepID=A0AAD1WF74_PELCU|nr:EF-hand calcium-binding domain-containing 14 isoform X1 [Pelobates cultripes]CAH2310724.1 EF-hand calcium-binding domain-containing 14 isoform X1 [Pelobates cultripes]
MGSGALSAGPQAPPTPHKKMKKRKELNALIGLSADGGRKKPKKGSGHRLLRTEPPASDSDSDSEEFGNPGGGGGRCGRGEFLQCCKICYPLCCFIVLAACVVTCIGLVWMQVALKENIDVLQERFRVMDSSQKNSLQDIPKIKDDLLTKQKHLEEIVTGEMGLNKLWANITEMYKQIELLISAVNHLKANMKSASDLINLPNTMEELQKSVATLGSTLTSVHHDVETMQTAAEEQKKKVETLQQDVSKLVTKDTSQALPTSPSVRSGTHDITQQEILYLQNTVEDLNATLIQNQKQNNFQFHNMDSTVANVSQRVTQLENDVQLLNKIQTKENSLLSPVDNITSPASSSNLTSSGSRTEAGQGRSKGQSQTSDLQEKLQLIHALTNKPEDVQRPAEDDLNKETTTSHPSISKRSLRFKRGSRFSLPGISTERDLKKLFKQSGLDINGNLSYQNLKDSLGPGIPQSLKEFDTDGDDRYSFTELKDALGF